MESIQIGYNIFRKLNWGCINVTFMQVYMSNFAALYSLHFLLLWRPCGNLPMISWSRGQPRLGTVTGMWFRNFTLDWTKWRTRLPSAGGTSQAPSSLSTVWISYGAPLSAPALKMTVLYKDCLSPDFWDTPDFNFTNCILFNILKSTYIFAQ